MPGLSVLRARDGSLTTMCGMLRPQPGHRGRNIVNFARIDGVFIVGRKQNINIAVCHVPKLTLRETVAVMHMALAKRDMLAGCRRTLS